MARRRSMTGEVIDAARAEQSGWSPKSCPHDQLLPRAVNWPADR